MTAEEKNESSCREDRRAHGNLPWNRRASNSPFICRFRYDPGVTIMCGVLGVSPAGYYAWRSRPESRRSATNRDLVDDIKRVHRDTHGRYGSPRIHIELKAQGRGVRWS
jgi:hypothetical protein